MDLGVRDRLYIVLGGSRGMGYEAARILAADGARLALLSRTGAQVDEAARKIAADHGVAVTAHAADAAATDGALEALIADIVATQGAPRGLLVTSGLTDNNGTLTEMSDAQWEATFQDVVMGHVRACRAVVPTMIAAGGGQIVTTSAYSARAAKGFLFGYAAMKAAIVNITKNLAKTYGGQGIRANCVCPGAFETDRVTRGIEETMANEGLSREEAAAFLVAETWKMPVAMRRPGLPREAGELMAFLLSERAAYLNGAIVNIDGGTDF
jgi:NAD(P)-dependent dehydrogenase (short-subunit alcohol dehydrogenase family)